MARLKVRLRGKVVSEISLQEGQVYVAGRKEDSPILLQPEKGISREHFQISFENGKWELKLLSRFGDMLVAGEKIQNLTLDEAQVFTVPPYEFEFMPGSEAAVEAPLSEPPSVEEMPSNDLSSMAGEIPPPFEPEERTVVGASTLLPVLKLLDTFQVAKKTFELDRGDVFLAGREASCQIHIDDQRVSRRQFELKKINGSFLITDLGSVNGTYLNGQMLNQNEPAPLKSGDVITVLDNQMVFELHDPNFHKVVNENRALAPLEPQQNNWSPVPAGYQNPPVQYDPSAYPQPVMYPPQQPYQLPSQNNKAKIVRFAIVGAVIVLVLSLVFIGDKDEKKKPTGQVAQSNDPLGKLNADEKMMVKHHYQLAENYLAQQKWMLAKGEIEKIKLILPESYKTYERAGELETTADQGLNSEREITEIEQREQMAFIQEQKIQDQVALCNKKFNPDITKEEMENCLQPVLQFNPEHPQIVQLRNRVEQLLTDKAVRESQKKEQDRLAGQLRMLYENAEAQERNQNYLDAIKAYEKVQRASLPDRGDYKGRAQRQVAAIKSRMNSQTSAYIKNAEKMASEKQYKQAILSLRAAKKIDPTNITLDEQIDSYIRELKKEMLLIFQEGVLEEGFGNLDGSGDRPGARALWRKILDQDIPDGEYYQKAKQRLKKYGAI